jgi:hypothetical protein
MLDMHQKRQHPGLVGSFFGLFLAFSVGSKLAWGLLVPSVADTAVEAGWLSASLPWTTAILFGLGVAALVSLIRHPRRHEHQRRGEVTGA